MFILIHDIVASFSWALIMNKYCAQYLPHYVEYSKEIYRWSF